MHVSTFICRFFVLLAIAAFLTATASAAEDPTIVFLIGEKEYETRETLPAFAADVLEPLGYECIFVHALQSQPNIFPGASAIDRADLLVISVRRRALPKADLDRVRAHLAAGKPIIALRTACHAFDPKGELPDGHDAWRTFDVDVLGARYDNHLDNDAGTTIDPVQINQGHSVLRDVPPQPFVSAGTLYRMFDLEAEAELLANGRAVVDGQTQTFPVAWTRITPDGSRVFATTLGHKSDFEQPAFRTLLKNAVPWCLQEANQPVAIR